MEKWFENFLELLNKHSVAYLVIGGFAVGYHGYPRYTGDIDVWIDPSEETADKMMQVMEEFGFGQDFTREDFLKRDSFMQIGFPPSKIDLLCSAKGVDFKECYTRKITERTIEKGTTIYFISLADLIANKKAVGRSRDLNDLENLPGIA
jgi:hypothetical protein